MKWKHPFDNPRNPNQQNLMSNEQDSSPKSVAEAEQQIKEKELAAKTALLARIENDFCYHAPKGDQVDRYQLIRQKALGLARVMVENCPISRELSVALTHLDNAVMAANSAIARNEK